MNQKQMAFTLEYVKDRNATQAAIRAGYSAKTAYSQAHDLLKKPEIMEEIERLLREAAERSAVTVDEIVGRLRAVATDPGEKTSDRLRADELLGKYLGMFTDRVHVGGSLDTGASKLAGILDQLKDDG